MSFSLDIKVGRDSLSRTDAGRVFHEDGAPQLKAGLLNDVHPNGLFTSVTDNERSDVYTAASHNASTSGKGPRPLLGT